LGGGSNTTSFSPLSASCRVSEFGVVAFPA